MSGSLVSTDPANPSKGSDFEICYDFSGGATSPVTLTLTWDPPQNPETVTLSAEDNCVTVTAADSAIDLSIVDSSGQSSDLGVTFI